MEMNKNQLTMAVIGGTGGLIALVVFALVWLQGTDIDQVKQEVAGLKSQCDTLRGVSREKGDAAKKKCAKLDELMSKRYSSRVNEELVEFTEKTGSQLQQQMKEDFKEFCSWPAKSSKKIIADDFLSKNGDQNFRLFFNYVREDGARAPKETERELVARQWSDFKHVISMMNDAEVKRLNRFADVPKPAEAHDVKARAPRNRRRPKTDSAAKDAASSYQEQRYEVEFEAKPAALVKFINLLVENSKWFFVIDSMSINGESFLQKIEGKKDNDKAGVAAEKQQIKSIVINPSTADALKVTMKITSVIFTQKEAK